MLVIQGRAQKTIADAAGALGVSTKTVRQWIDRGILPDPPEEPYGSGFVKVFPDEWIEDAKIRIAQRREQRRNGASRSDTL